MAQNQIYKQLSPYKFFKIETTTRTGTAFQRIKRVKGVKLKMRLGNVAYTDKMEGKITARSTE
jgi:hypothetical protein